MGVSKGGAGKGLLLWQCQALCRHGEQLVPRLSRIIHCNPAEGRPTHIRARAHTPCRAAGEVEVKELASVTACAQVSSAEA